MYARIRIASVCAALLAAVACGGSAPTSPSATGATITGTVVWIPPTPPTALTVTVAGTKLASAVDAAGTFQLGGVPTGNVQLVFGGSGAGSAVSLANVADQEVIELQVAINAGTATVQQVVRGASPGKLVMCHLADSGGYHPIDVSVSAEQAHRAHGDARPGELVPADPSKVFDSACRLISPVDIEKLTNGQHVAQAPGPTIPVDSPITWTYVITNRSALTFTSLSVTDDREVAVACPKMLPQPGASITCTATGTAVAGQYRNVGTVTVTASGREFTASDASYYFGGPVSAVTIEKFVNGQHVDQAPGPTIPVGSPVTWTYVVTNRGALAFTSLSVTDDRGVAVACPKVLPEPGASLTCTGSGTAVAGQYHNIGTAVATAGGITYTASDDSFYFGGDAGDTRKVQLCHHTGNGSYHLIEVSVSAEPAHRAHGDARPGEAVPGSPDLVFTASCGVK
jgi:hypothetical protein